MKIWSQLLSSGSLIERIMLDFIGSENLASTIFKFRSRHPRPSWWSIWSATRCFRNRGKTQTIRWIMQIYTMEQSPWCLSVCLPACCKLLLSIFLKEDPSIKARDEDWEKTSPFLWDVDHFPGSFMLRFYSLCDPSTLHSKQLIKLICCGIWRLSCIIHYQMLCHKHFINRTCSFS